MSPLNVVPEELGAAVTGAKALGVTGCNVTIPYKSRIMQYLDELDESAEAAGFYDMIYVPQITPLLQEAVGWGLKGAKGFGMLAALGETCLHNLDRCFSAIRLDEECP
jgi:shikimate dehydrogenase